MRKEKKGGKPEDLARKWLDEVEFVITPGERKEWELLRDDAERRRFIDEFWKLRTPEGSSPEAVRAEHQRRVEFADQRFTAGKRGSKTDRGRTYITLGPPDNVTRMMPGPARALATRDEELVRRFGAERMLGQDKPAEIWSYRHVPGAVSTSNELRFLYIDRHFSGLYELAYEFGDVDRLNLLDSDRTLVAEQNELGTRIATDSDIVGIQRELRRDIEERRALADSVTQAISFARLEVAADWAFFRGLGGRTLVAATLVLSAADLAFAAEEGAQVASLEIDGRLITPDGRNAATVDSAVRLTLDAERFAARRDLRPRLAVSTDVAPGDYAVELVVLDRRQSRVGVVRDVVRVPSFAPGRTTLSSVLLATDLTRPATGGAPVPGSLEIGGLALSPLGGEPVAAGTALGIYFQVYDPGVRALCSCPDLLVDYTLRRDGRLVRRLGDGKQLSAPVSGLAPLVSAGRMVDLAGLPPGRYSIVASVEDRVRGTATWGEAELTLK